MTPRALGCPTPGSPPTRRCWTAWRRWCGPGATAAVIADADTGYGGLLNVHHTVRGYEAAGVTAIQLEDQEFPKKCGHRPVQAPDSAGRHGGKDQGRGRGADGRGEFSDHRPHRRAPEQGLEGALRSDLRPIAAAGADILFPEALTSEEEMRKACAAFDKPMMANMADGGLTPILPAASCAELGYAFAIFPSMTSLAPQRRWRGADSAEEPGRPYVQDEPLFNFKEFCGLDRNRRGCWAFERTWAKSPKG